MITLMGMYLVGKYDLQMNNPVVLIVMDIIGMFITGLVAVMYFNRG
jgi:hypothetical protein